MSRHDIKRAPGACSALLAAGCMLSAAAMAGDNATLEIGARAQSQGSAWSGFDYAALRWQRDAPLRNTVRGALTARHERGNGTRLELGELSLERPLGAGFASIGKKVMSWDVGYAFRPLDVVQQEDRRALDPVALEGVPMLAWKAFDADRAITVVLSNPGRRRARQPRGDGALAVRLYRQHGARDEYAVLRLSGRDGVEGGLAFSQVATPELELHASMLLQQRHETLPASGVAAHWQRHDGGGKALAGFTWTNASRFSVLGEAWVDCGARIGQQRNLLLQAARNDGDLDLRADVLWQPQNGARIVSVAASWKPGPWLLSARLRHYGGVAGTTLRNMALATAQYAF